MSNDVCRTADELVASLRSMQQELSEPATDPATGMPVSKLPLEQVRQLKLVVDELRLFLWAYLDTWSQGRGESADALQRIRIGAVTDMLHALESGFRNCGLPNIPELEILSERVRSFSATISALPRH